MISEPYLDEVRARWEAIRDIAIEIAGGSDGHAKILTRHGAREVELRVTREGILPVTATFYSSDTPSRTSLGSWKHSNPAVSCRLRMPPESACASLRQARALGRPSSSLTEE
jgi:hypothetical protein